MKSLLRGFSGHASFLTVICLLAPECISSAHNHGRDTISDELTHQYKLTLPPGNPSFTLPSFPPSLPPFLPLLPLLPFPSPFAASTFRLVLLATFEPKNILDRLLTASEHSTILLTIPIDDITVG